MAQNSTTSNESSTTNVTTQIAIKTANPTFMDLKSLFADQFNVTAVTDKSIKTTELVYGVGVDMKCLQDVLKNLSYLPIAQVRSTVMSPNMIELRLGRFEHELHTFSVKTNTSQFLQSLQGKFGTV